MLYHVNKSWNEDDDSVISVIQVYLFVKLLKDDERPNSSWKRTFARLR